ncbi:MAG: ABC transporter permease subunit [Oscillospiraceae bacterium]|nr:ABC transporter permease subunit [Oscillospiraceae bacterium]
MTNSTVKRLLRWVLFPLLWIGVWYAVALIVNREVLVPTPARVFVRLWELVQTAAFWTSVSYSILRVTAGFLAGVLLGTLTGILTAKLPLSEGLLSPLLTVIRATPVASFIILALVWMGREAIPVFISFLMVFPIMQSHVHTGVRAVSPELLEMAQVYRVPKMRKVRALYAPAVLPNFSAGCRTCLGLAWKAGVAAEVISLPARSIGRELHNSKLYLETVDVFAWTVTVVVLSLLIEKLLRALLLRLTKGGDET